LAQNIYDRPDFFEGYSRLGRSVDGLDGAMEWPALRAMLPDMSGLRVVDLGCGFGWFCRWARTQGAVEVVGFDLSEKMLARAEATTPYSAISYARVDLEQLDLPQARFSPTDASPPAFAGDGARLGADVVRYSVIVTDLHHRLLAGFYRRTPILRAMRWLLWRRVKIACEDLLDNALGRSLVKPEVKALSGRPVERDLDGAISGRESEDWTDALRMQIASIVHAPVTFRGRQRLDEDPGFGQHHKGGEQVVAMRLIDRGDQLCVSADRGDGRAFRERPLFK
jgi:SAM-dependent methyltransferase